MKQAINIQGLNTDSRVFSVEGDTWDADVVKGESIRIFGVAANYLPTRCIDRTFKVGDRAVYDSYNLIYTGAIVSITDKTVTINVSSTGGRTKRLPLAVFWTRNAGRTMEEVDAHNAIESQCI